MKPIRLTAHALGYLSERGTSQLEIEDAIRSARWELADRGRLECRKQFQYGTDWNDTFYATKQVRPIFVEEDDEIVVITVYTYCY